MKPLRRAGLALSRPFRISRGDLDLQSRLTICSFGASGVGIYWLGHALASMEALEDLPSGLAAQAPGFLRGVLPVVAVVFILSTLALFRGEEALGDTRDEKLDSLGVRSVRYGLLVVLVTGLGGLVLTIRSADLLGAWDQGFLWVVLAIQYIGAYFFLYNGVPISRWASPHPETEMKQLQLVWDQQRMFLRAFSFITFTILVGQVFAVLQLKYGKIWNDLQQWNEQSPYILINAAQLAFLVLGWWGLVFARILRRMEHVLLRMKRLSASANQ